MKALSIKSLTLMTLMAATIVLVVATVRANDDGAPQGIGEIELVEWDGKNLTSRIVPYFSEDERAFIEDHNEMTQNQAELWQRYRSGQLPDTPDNSIIETEHGIVTVNKTVGENSVLPQPEKAAVEITTSWSAYYTYGRVYAAAPGYVYGFGPDDYRCH